MRELVEEDPMKKVLKFICLGLIMVMMLSLFVACNKDGEEPATT